MKKIILLLSLAVLLTACQAPSYFYDPNYGDYITQEEYNTRYGGGQYCNLTIIIHIDGFTE